MTDRLTGVEVQSQLLDEMRRMRQAVETIRLLLLIEFALAIIGAFVLVGTSGR